MFTLWFNQINVGNRRCFFTGLYGRDEMRESEWNSKRQYIQYFSLFTTITFRFEEKKTLLNSIFYWIFFSPVSCYVFPSKESLISWQKTKSFFERRDSKLGCRMKWNEVAWGRHFFYWKWIRSEWKEFEGGKILIQVNW